LKEGPSPFFQETVPDFSDFSVYSREAAIPGLSGKFKKEGRLIMFLRYKVLFGVAILLSFIPMVHIPGAFAADANIVKPGDNVGIQFTCRFKNNEIASSTSTAVAKSSDPKSSIFLPRTVDDPIAVTAEESSNLQQPRDFIAFEDEIVLQLAHSITGMPMNGSKTVELHADRIAGL
jgi:hypothetical protein